MQQKINHLEIELKKANKNNFNLNKKVRNERIATEKRALKLKCINERLQLEKRELEKSLIDSKKTVIQCELSRHGMELAKLENEKMF